MTIPEDLLPPFDDRAIPIQDGEENEQYWQSLEDDIHIEEVDDGQ